MSQERSKPRVAFVCVHNSCRSQMAEALTKYYGGERVDAFSGGTALKSAINPQAVALIKELYGIDMNETQRPKLLTELPEVDRVVTMGCNVVCPVLPYEYESEDWGLEDPTGKPREEFIQVIREIDEKVQELLKGL
ncbi:MAG: arsenate reductase ArsC [Tissierellia bacterium]|nr:arsenate reductase ArsC [Tissierellia bacterium]